MSKKKKMNYSIEIIYMYIYILIFSDDIFYGYILHTSSAYQRPRWVNISSSLSLKFFNVAIVPLRNPNADHERVGSSLFWNNL